MKHLSTARLCLLAGLLLAALPAAAFERAPVPGDGALKPCPEHGAGFTRIPGTGTCVRVSGRVAAGADVGAGHAARDPVGGRLAVDTRAQTDYGDARGFVRLESGGRWPR